MKIIKHISKTPALILIVSLLLSIQTLTAQAHPADIYANSINLTITSKELWISWEIKPGPILASYLLNQADLDQDGKISAEEADAWGEKTAPFLSATLNGQAFPLQLKDVLFPFTEGYQAGTDPILLEFAADWPEGAENVLYLVLDNAFERQNSLNWFSISVKEDSVFRSPVQEAGTLDVEVYRDRTSTSGVTGLLSSWDSGTPSLPAGQQKDVVSQTAEQMVPELAKNTPQDILAGLVREEQISIQFYVFALGISLALGALHALTPGHGKTVVAAYLVGSRGTTKHAVALGGIVTVTHTGSVFLLGLVTLAASRYFLPTRIIPVLEVISGLLIVGLGFYLLFQRVQSWKREKAHQHAHEHGHDHHHEHEHSHEIPEAITWRSLIALGVSGGLVPCPDAIAILLVALAINRLMLGLSLIVAFSLGLAVVLIVIGLAMVNSRRLFNRMDVFSRFAPLMPVVSAAAVLILGLALTYGAYARFQGNAVIAGAGRLSAGDAQAFELAQARIVFLSEDQAGEKQLVVANTKGRMERMLTAAPKGVIDFALSPDQSQIVYAYQTEDYGNDLWLISVDGTQDRELVRCEAALCSQPVWSPDGKRVVFEKMDFGSEGVFTGLSSLWWLDIETGESNPVFQDSQLPGSNPRWSPDGNWLSYSTQDGLRLYNLATGENRNKKNTLAVAANWSPDGKWVLFRDVILMNEQFVTQLFLYTLSSGNVENLDPNTNMENILAAWSPDGTQIAVVRRDLSAPRGDQIWVMQADGSDAHQITDAPTVLHGSLNWSPNGQFILYDSFSLDADSLESRVQIVDVSSGEIMDFGLIGDSPKWIVEEN